MRLIRRKNARFLMLVRSLMNRTIMVLVVAIAILWMNQNRESRNRRRRRFSLVDRIPSQITNMRDLVEVSDDDCKKMLRMDRVAFVRLCSLLQTAGGLNNSKYVTAQEKVAMFLSILAHHTKNRSVMFQFKRSGQTVSKYFHHVLRAVLKLHSLFLVKPQPIPDDSTDPRWQKFKDRLDEFMNNQDSHDGNHNVDIIDSLEATPEWTTWRDNLAQSMFNEWSARQCCHLFLLVFLSSR
ncbi:hypothetical protein ACS0TY_035598 [Phlomoides rotata]